MVPSYGTTLRSAAPVRLLTAAGTSILARQTSTLNWIFFQIGLQPCLKPLLVATLPPTHFAQQTAKYTHLGICLKIVLMWITFLVRIQSVIVFLAHICMSLPAVCWKSTRTATTSPPSSMLPSFPTGLSNPTTHSVLLTSQTPFFPLVIVPVAQQ